MNEIENSTDSSGVKPQLPPCPECQSEYAYESGDFLACPMCGHEWIPGAADELAVEQAASEPVVRDCVGNPLQDGDDVTIARDLKVKGGSTIKIGTRVTGIRLLDSPVDGHDIDGRVPGTGQLYLKSSVVKKV